MKIYFGSAKAIIIVSIALKTKLLCMFSFVRNGFLLALQKRKNTVYTTSIKRQLWVAKITSLKRKNGSRLFLVVQEVLFTVTYFCAD